MLPRNFRAGAAACVAGALAVLVASPASAADTASPSASASPSPTVSASSTAAPSGTATSAPADTTAVGVPGQPTIESVYAVPTGRVLNVTVRPPATLGSGPIIRYDFSLNGESWMPCDAASTNCTVGSLQNGTTYWVVVRAVNAAGPSAPSAPRSGTPRVYDPDKPATLPKPHTWVTASFNAASNGLGVDGSKVRLGVGTLPKLTFSTSIPSKKAVERHLRVTATDDTGRTHHVKGAWGWLDDRSAVYRPEKYWPGNSTIDIISTLDRAVLGKSGNKYLVGSESLATTYSFKTARKMIIKVDGEAVRMKVFVDGVRKKVFPVSLGKSEWETRNGVKVIGSDKQPTHTYTSTSLNLDTRVEEPYVLEDIPWNTRLTPTGEFIHSAPWAYGRIGRYNGSHGCTNMFESDAKWIYDKTIPGDVVIYENTGGGTVQSWNGPGGLWNIPWADWLKKSALGSASGAVVTGDTARPVGAAESASA